ncbi:MAG: glutaredoxin family protein [Chloroflexi bacterium]|nr:glutaredoxin family protein [Chloroflexota bacterium]
MVTPPMPSERIVLYGAEGCHLCESAREVVVAHLRARAAAGRPVAGLVDVDIHSDDRLLRAFLETIPVLAAGDARLELATSPSKIRSFLDAALDRALDAALDGATPRGEAAS